MTTMAKVIRKVEKRAARAEAKRNRKAHVETHNLTFVHQQLVEAQAKTEPKFFVQDQMAWASPFKSTEVKAPSLKEMFFIQDDNSTEPQQG